MVCKYVYNKQNGTVTPAKCYNDREAIGELKLSERIPTVKDRMQVLNLLLQFNAIKSPKSGTALDKVIPQFKSVYELERWQKKKILEKLN